MIFHGPSQRIRFKGCLITNVKYMLYFRVRPLYEPILHVDGKSFSWGSVKKPENRYILSLYSLASRSSEFNFFPFDIILFFGNIFMAIRKIATFLFHCLFFRFSSIEKKLSLGKKMNSVIFYLFSLFTQNQSNTLI